MKVVLVRPPSFKMPIIIPNLGLGYLASVLKADNHTVSILDCAQRKMNHQKYRDYLADEKPDVVGVQMYTCDFNSTRKCVDMAKEINRNIITLVGGPHPSGDSHGTMKMLSNTDFAFSGEAELGLPKLLRHLQSPDTCPMDSIEGLIYRDHHDILKNKRGSFDNLDDIPFPCWDLIDPGTYPAAPHGSFSKTLPIAPIITSRGCPFHCTYCAVAVNTGRSFRMRSIHNIIEEIKYLQNIFGIKEFHIEDDNFTLAKSRVIELCKRIQEENISVHWACTNGVRLDTLDAELLTEMEKSGCYSFSVGIESGSPRIIANMKRSETLEVMTEKINMIASKTKIRMTGYFMMGYPGETKSDMEMTMDYAMKLPLHRAQFSNFLPLPGTEIYDQLIEDKEISPDVLQWDLYQNNRIVYCPIGISRKDMRRLMRKAFARFYLRVKIISGLLKEINSLDQFRTVIRRFFDVFR